MTDYEKLKHVIWDANPSILELKFGCEVLEHEIGRGIILDKPIERNGVVAAYVFDFVDGKPKNLPFMKDKMQILGRDITLADVLLALQKIVIKDRTYLVSSFGIIIDTYFKSYATWDLKRDSLDDQSEECKQFLINLLVTK